MIPGVGIVATLVSGSWWNPLDWQGFVDGIVEGMGEALVWLLNLAFNNPLTVVSAAEWQAAFGQAARWGGVFAVVAVAMCAVEIVAGIIASDHGRILRGWVWAILAWPLTAASLLIFSRLVNVSDWLTTAILDSVQAPEAVTGAVVVTGATSAATTALVGMLLGVSALSTWWLALVFVGLALLPVIGLVIVLGAVTFGQIAMAGFAPVALTLIGFRGTRAMSAKWLQMAVALLLTKPVAAGIIALGCAVGSQGGADGLILGIIAVTVAMGSPALAFSFVSFAGAQLGGALTAHADKVKGLVGSVTYAGANQGVAALRDRLGGAAKAAAATAGVGAAGVAAGGAGFGGSGSTTASGMGLSRPMADGPGSASANTGKGEGAARSAERGGSNGSGKDSGKTGRLASRLSGRGRGPVPSVGPADVVGDDGSGRGGGPGTAEPAMSDSRGTGTRGAAGRDPDGAWPNPADATPQAYGWTDEGALPPPTTDDRGSGDASRLAGPVGASTGPLEHDAGSSGGTAAPPADPSGMPAPATSGASGASPTAVTTAAPPSAPGSSQPAARKGTDVGSGRPDGGTGSATQRSGDTPPTTRRGSAPMRAEEPAQQGPPLASTPETPTPTLPADGRGESGPNPFGGPR